jgi:hypothetical protein
MPAKSVVHVWSKYRGILIAACLALVAATGAPSVPAQIKDGPAHASKAHRHQRLPLTNFYELPKPSPNAKPGALIRSERTYDYSLSADVVTTRILYYSRAADGNAVAVSAVVIVPERAAPPGGWPIIAWAHGFVGVARKCAPSLRENLDEGSFLSMYVNLGYAMVATDYAGLGTSARNAYLDLQSNAADLIYSVEAARAAVADLGPQWIAMGISEGGLAAIGAAELESQIQDSRYLGSIALSGLVDGNNLLSQHSAQESSLHPIFLAYGIKTVFPQLQVNDVLTEQALPVFRQAATSCAIGVGATHASPGGLLKPNWQENEFVKKFIERNSLGTKRAAGPVLVLASATDPSTPIMLTTEVVGRLCKQRDRVQFYRYENPDPRAAIGDSVRDQIGWIQARFARRAAPSNCP